MYNLLILVYIVQIEDIRGELRESNNKHERCLLLKFTDKMQHGLKTDVKEGTQRGNSPFGSCRLASITPIHLQNPRFRCNIHMYM